jgi:hypothetical protein
VASGLLVGQPEPTMELGMSKAEQLPALDQSLLADIKEETVSTGIATAPSHVETPKQSVTPDAIAAAAQPDEQLHLESTSGGDLIAPAQASAPVAAPTTPTSVAVAQTSAALEELGDSCGSAAPLAMPLAKPSSPKLAVAAVPVIAAEPSESIALQATADSVAAETDDPCATSASTSLQASEPVQASPQPLPLKGELPTFSHMALSAADKMSQQPPLRCAHHKGQLQLHCNVPIIAPLARQAQLAQSRPASPPKNSKGATGQRSDTVLTHRQAIVAHRKQKADVQHQKAQLQSPPQNAAAPATAQSMPVTTSILRDPPRRGYHELLRQKQPPPSSIAVPISKPKPTTSKPVADIDVLIQRQAQEFALNHSASVISPLAQTTSVVPQQRTLNQMRAANDQQRLSEDNPFVAPCDEDAHLRFHQKHLALLQQQHLRHPLRREHMDDLALAARTPSPIPPVPQPQVQPQWQPQRPAAPAPSTQSRQSPRAFRVLHYVDTSPPMKVAPTGGAGAAPGIHSPPQKLGASGKPVRRLADHLRLMHIDGGGPSRRFPGSPAQQQQQQYVPRPNQFGTATSFKRRPSTSDEKQEREKKSRL